MGTKGACPTPRGINCTLDRVNFSGIGGLVVSSAGLCPSWVASCVCIDVVRVQSGCVSKSWTYRGWA
ncbi:hypothetical protein M6B38_339945 [Iris pallida]|uniref:Uncharacterized protein n=1 Tax=Iris pallida TaxID=29817 RepID=A0AAX6GXH0_IRIPA|nr:hypothetical protein M6B38_339945 [Iris pallida]